MSRASLSQFQPQRATGLVLHFKGSAFLGSCFAFRRADSYFTARHCIGDLPTDDIAILQPAVHPQQVLRVRDVVRHPTADLAILRVGEEHSRSVHPFTDWAGNYFLGEDFWAYGYPEDLLRRRTQVPTPRIFKGHYQRYFSHQSPLGYCYDAAEMSIPAPHGLTGGPVFRDVAPLVVTGLVTENLESPTVLWKQEESTLEERMTQGALDPPPVISYGVVLLLDYHGPWLEENGVIRPTT